MIFYRPRLIVLAALAIATGILLTATVFGLKRRSAVASYVPPTPVVSTMSSELADRLGAAEQQARGWFRQIGGLVELSRLYHANGYYDEALQCYEGLKRLQPGDARWYHLSASILAESGRLQEAIEPMRRAIVLDPIYLPSRLRLGDILLNLNRTADAARAYGEAGELEQANPYALLGLARCALAGGDWAKAREYLGEAIAAHPDFVGALSLMITVSEHFGDAPTEESCRLAMGDREFVDLADAWREALAEECYDPYRLSVAAAVANAAGDVALAKRRLERAISLGPTTAAYRRQLAAILTREGDTAGARTQLARAVDINASDSDAWLRLVQNYENTGEFEAADRTLTKGLVACPLSPSLHLERARRWKALGRDDAAVAEYRESYHLRPSEAEPLIGLAGIYYTQNRPDDAIAVLKEALQKQPEHPVALATLTLVYIGLSDERSALAGWEQVRKLPTAPPAMVNAIRQAFQQQFGRALE